MSSARRFGVATLIVVLGLLGTACGEEEPVVIETEAEPTGVATPEPTATPTPVEEVTAESEPEPTEEPSQGPQGAPDFVGMTESQARNLASASGLDLVVEKQESIEGDPGTVLDQVPQSGRRLTQGTVTVIVATGLPNLPDFVGLPVAAARAWLDEREVETRIESMLTTEAERGTVLSTVPAAGESVDAEVLVTVAERPYTEALTDWEIAEETCRSVGRGDTRVNGETLPRSLSMDMSRSHSWDCWIEYTLGRDWERFEATIGFDDNSTSSSSGRFEVMLDGEIVETHNLVYGEDRTLVVDVTDVLRLRLSATMAQSGDMLFTWGSARVIGDPDNANRG